MRKTLILIDGHSLAFRQYFALERTGMKTAQNIPSWAVYGFFKAVFDLLLKIKPDFIAVAFDVGRQTFRVEKYEQYKANRETMPDAMRIQMGLIVEGLKAFDIPIYTKEGFEADDVIGTISKKASDAGHNTLILTGDQDAFQLIDDEGQVKVLIPSKGELVEYDKNQVYAKLGVYPEQITDYKGLRGDTSDNIPGIRGIGEKTAQKLLERYPNLEAVLADCENIPEKAIREKICNGKDDAILSKELATIIRDVDIDFDINSACVVMPDLEKVSDFLRGMQFYSFIKNINKILSAFNSSSPCEAEPQSGAQILITPQQDAGSGAIQQNLFTQALKETVNDTGFDCVVISDENTAQQTVKELLNTDEIAVKALYTEEKKELAGFGVSSDKNYYFGIEYFDIFRPVMESSSVKKVSWDAKTDIRVLLEHGVNYRGLSYDVLLASYVSDPNRNHSLDAQGLDFINHIMLERGMPNVDDKVYACDCAYTIKELAKYWREHLTEKEQKLVVEVEVPLTMVLAKMENTGVAINTEYLEELSSYMREKLAELEDIIYQMAGTPFNINSPKQVAEILYDKLGIKSKKKKSRTTSAEVLEELAEDNEICDYILQHRKFSKLKSTYTDVLPTLVDKRDGRVHTTFNQALTATGRLSSSNPNLQNIPIRTEEGNKIRSAFCAEDKENSVILSADYSQIELRLLAHVSGDEHLLKAFNDGVDVHTQTASKVFGVKPEEVTKEMRRKAKAVNFGIVYGQSKYGLAKAIGVKAADAQMFIDKYFEHFPKVHEYMDYERKFVAEHGYVETIYGRRRYLGAELGSSNFQIREFAQRAAINQPLQGSAADLIKMAIIDVDRRLVEGNYKTRMVLQVHDELIFEVPKSELENVTKIVRESMELGQPLKVRLEVDIVSGATWKE